MSIPLLFKRLKALETSPKYIARVWLYNSDINRQIRETKKAIAIASKGKYFTSFL